MDAKCVCIFMGIGMGMGGDEAVDWERKWGRRKKKNKGGGEDHF